MSSVFDSPLTGLIAIILILAFLAVFIPQFFVTSGDSQIHTVTLTEGQSTSVNDPISALLTVKNQSAINVTLIDAKAGESQSFFLENETNSTSITLQNTSFNTTYLNDLSETRAVISVEYESFYAWNTPAVTYLKIFISVVVIVLFLFIIYSALDVGI